MIEYKYVDYKSIQRIIMLIKLNKIVKIDKITEFSNEIVNILKSKILLDKFYFFPSKSQNYKDFTYFAVLSSSHLVISSYTNDSEMVLDVDVAWCSGEKLNIEKLRELVKKIFGEDSKILSLKIYDYLGNVMMAFSTEDMMIAEFTDI